MRKRQIDVVVIALEEGSSIDEAAALAKMTTQDIETAWLTGRDDFVAERKTPEARLYVEGRAAAARWRVGRRMAATEAADSGHRSSGDHLRLLEEAKSQRVEPEARSAHDPLIELNISNATPELLSAAQTFMELLAARQADYSQK